MIESIHIADVATFVGAPVVLDKLSQFNYFFGSNGSGKTTISRVVSDNVPFPACRISWRGGTQLQAMVYNADFVARNFSQSSHLKGIFTLGESNVGSIAKIAAVKAELESIATKKEKLHFNLHGAEAGGGKIAELAALELEIKTKCWVQKQKHDVKLSGAFEGYRNNADKFKAKLLQEAASNSATVATIEDIHTRAETLFGSTPIVEQQIAGFDLKTVLAHETNEILKKRVIGKEDVDVAGLIKKLGNSDWVREGVSFYKQSDLQCPFCQQTTKASLLDSLEEYFDLAFQEDSAAIEALITNYATDSARLQQNIAAVIANSPRFLEVDKLKSEKDLLDSKLLSNIQALDSKKREPSQVVTLDSIGNVVSSIRVIIDTANHLTSQHNNRVSNLTQERRGLTAQVWKHLIEIELKQDLVAWGQRRSALESAVKSMSDQIASLSADEQNKLAEIRVLERATTSIQPTIDAINGLLMSFGFHGFVLANAEKTNSYKLIRADGKDAKETLSEGEKTFITFLYFYHLLKGSNSDAGITTDRVVVFDDPVSSLDSEILFIVGSLVKGLFEEIRLGVGNIKQLFMLTHNVYFHKEVSFNPKRSNNAAMKDETFWTIRKAGLHSTLERHESNPIKTSYELLWSEVRRQDRSNLSIQNTLRRILENYFRILGGIDPDKICSMFEGRERLICKSLFSWVNDGSHFAHDDLYISMDSTQIDTYLKVFKRIFEQSGHAAHYKMMMGHGYADAPSIAMPVM
jgi:wobble nucleotide-excising tRNase